MKRNTIKWRIFKYNLIVIFLMIAMVTLIFNASVNMYIERDILGQLDRIASRTEITALQQGPDFFPDNRGKHHGIPPRNNGNNNSNNNELFRYYFMLDRSLREPLSVLNADYILIDSSRKIITPSPEEFTKLPPGLIDKITAEIAVSGNYNKETHLNFRISGINYAAIIKPVLQKNSFGLGWIAIYSSLEKIDQLRLMIYIILIAILILSALIIVIFSSLTAKKISAPFTSLSGHIRDIAERNFKSKINMQVDDELKDFVNNINIMSEKLETYDKAQKTFLQNASHEFRTPLMSIQSYAEGIKYNVIDNISAADIIIEESKRMTLLVEDLLYLSRLDTIEENYNFQLLLTEDLMRDSLARMSGIASRCNIKLLLGPQGETVDITADYEKLSRAITNVIDNCIRYAKATVLISSSVIDSHLKITIEDDGTGFEEDELPNVFERFYKGKKGISGLGLAISRNVIEKHEGSIIAENTDAGARFTILLPVADK